MLRAAVIVCALLNTACATSQVGLTPIGETYSPRPETHTIEIFKGGKTPDRPYQPVAKLDVHLEATHFITNDFDNAEKSLKSKAREAGGDAIIDVKETKSRLLETHIYHVSGTAVRYTP